MIYHPQVHVAAQMISQLPVMNYGDEGAKGIMETIPKVDLPQKTGSAR